MVVVGPEVKIFIRTVMQVGKWAGKQAGKRAGRQAGRHIRMQGAGRNSNIKWQYVIACTT